MVKLLAKIHLKKIWSDSNDHMDVVFGRSTIVLGVIGFLVTQFSGFGGAREKQQLGETEVQGDVLKMIGDARMRYRDSAVWHDLTSGPENFIAGDSIFTASGSFVTVRYRDFEPAQIYPNSLVVLHAGTKSGASGAEKKSPYIEAKKGKVKIFLNAAGKGPRVRMGGKEYDFASMHGDSGGAIEMELISRGSGQSTEVASSTQVEMQTKDLTQGVNTPPVVETLTPRPEPKNSIPRPSDSSQGEILTKAKEFKTQQADIRRFLKETEKLSYKEKVQVDVPTESSQMEREVLRSLNDRLKKAGFKSKLEK